MIPANWRASAVEGGTPGRDETPTPELAGDYDNSGVVDQQDYGVWRGSYGKSVPPGSGADGNADGMVDTADYVLWRMNLGAQLAAAVAAAIVADSGATEPGAAQAVAVVAGAPVERDSRSDGELFSERASAIDLAMRESGATRHQSSARVRSELRLAHDDSHRFDDLLVDSARNDRLRPRASNAAVDADPLFPESLPDATRAADDVFDSLDGEELTLWAV